MLKLRNLFTDRQVLIARGLATREDGFIDFDRMAAELNAFLPGVGSLTPALMEYWSSQFDKVKSNGEHYLTLTIANREKKKNRNVRVPTMQDGFATDSREQVSGERILCFGDTHAPYAHQDALAFLRAVRDEYKPTMIVHTGDEVDNHALSFHDTDPNLDSAGRELEKSRAWIAELHLLFPILHLVESNHGSLAYRKAKAHGIPAAYLRSYREILFPQGGGAGWDWRHKIRVENPYGRDIQFQHQGTGDLMQLAAHENANVIVGHEHSKFGIGYAANAIETYWSVYTGWLGDTDALAFAYAKETPKKQVLGCAFIWHGMPQLIPMRTDKHNRWTGDL